MLSLLPLDSHQRANIIQPIYKTNSPPVVAMKACCSGLPLRKTLLISFQELSWLRASSYSTFGIHLSLCPVWSLAGPLPNTPSQWSNMPKLLNPCHSSSQRTLLWAIFRTQLPVGLAEPFSELHHSFFLRHSPALPLSFHTCQTCHYLEAVPNYLLPLHDLS